MGKVREFMCVGTALFCAGLAIGAPPTGDTPGQPAKPLNRPLVTPPERGAPPNDVCTGAVTIPSNGTVIADQTGATTSAEEPGFSCHNGGAGTQGFCNIWYQFVATATSVRIQTCATTAVGDSLLALYDVDEGNPCGSLVEIACSDDECGFTEFLSRVDVLGLVVGQTYYIQLGAWTPADCGPYTMQLQSPIPLVDVPCPAGATQENEPDCISINGGCSGQSPGGVDPLASTPLTLPATVCGTSRLDQVTPTVVRDNDYFRFNIPSESAVTVTIQAEFNAQVGILNTGGALACPAALAFFEQMNPVAGELGTINVCLPAGDWLLLVRPQATQGIFGCAEERGYVLGVSSTGACQECELTPGKGADFEGELTATGECGGIVSGTDFFNGGCNSVPPVFSALECGQTIFGTTASSGGTRDTDWYDITLAEETTVTWEGTSEFYELVIGIIEANPDTGDCPSTGFRIAGVVPNCSTGSITDTLPAGRYFFFAASDFTPAIACPASESDPNYRVTLTCGKGGQDCNENGIPDAQDIAAGARDCFDTDATQTPGGPYVGGGPNGIPDECECVADWNRDGVANSTDVGEHINTYFLDQSTGTTVFADIDCNGISNSTDVGEFINIYFAAQASQLPFSGCQL